MIVYKIEIIEKQRHNRGLAITDPADSFSSYESHLMVQVLFKSKYWDAAHSDYTIVCLLSKSYIVVNIMLSLLISYSSDPLFALPVFLTSLRNSSASSAALIG